MGKKAAFSGILLVLILVGGELLVRSVILSLRGPLLYETDPSLGYRLRPNLDVTRGNEPYTWRLRTDSSGYRFVDESSALGGGKRVVVVGDSFAFGEGVSDEATVASLLSRAGFSVVNLGVPGYGTHQELILLRKYFARAQADFVIVLVYSNDLDDVICRYKNLRHRPVAFLQNGVLTMSEFRPPLRDYLIDHSYALAAFRSLFNRTQRVEGDGAAIVVSCLAAMKEEGAERKDCQFLFFCHDAVNPGKLTTLLKEAERRDIELTDLSAGIRESKENVIGPDGFHWNSRGCERVCGLVLEKLRQQENVSLDAHLGL